MKNSHMYSFLSVYFSLPHEVKGPTPPERRYKREFKGRKVLERQTG